MSEKSKKERLEEALKQYEKVKAQALEQYKKVNAPAWEQYEKVKMQIEKEKD